MCLQPIRLDRSFKTYVYSTCYITSIPLFKKLVYVVKPLWHTVDQDFFKNKKSLKESQAKCPSCRDGWGGSFYKNLWNSNSTSFRVGALFKYEIWAPKQAAGRSLAGYRRKWVIIHIHNEGEDFCLFPRNEGGGRREEAKRCSCQRSQSVFRRLAWKAAVLVEQAIKRWLRFVFNEGCSKTI